MILICILNEIIKLFSNLNMLVLPTNERHVFNDLTNVARLISFDILNVIFSLVFKII